MDDPVPPKRERGLRSPSELWRRQARDARLKEADRGSA